MNNAADQEIGKMRNVRLRSVQCPHDLRLQSKGTPHDLSLNVKAAVCCVVQWAELWPTFRCDGREGCVPSMSMLCHTVGIPMCLRAPPADPDRALDVRCSHVLSIVYDRSTVVGDV